MDDLTIEYPGIWIWGYNRTNIDFRAGDGVAIGAATREVLATEHPVQVPHDLSRVESTTKVWGVALEPINPGRCGKVQLSGVCPAIIIGAVTDYARPDSGRLCYTSDGYPVFRRHTDEESSLPLIRLGGEPITEFHGQFKVIYDPETLRYRCIDGTDPSNAAAGTTDLGSVPAGEITPTERTFYLYAHWAGDHYALSFSRPASGVFGKLQLAHLSPGGAVVQDHTTGFIHWSEYYTV